MADYANRLAAFLRAVVEENLWPHFDLVRTLNDPMRDYLVRHGVPAERSARFSWDEIGRGIVRELFGGG